MKSYKLTYAAVAILLIVGGAMVYWAYFKDSGGSDFEVVGPAPAFELQNLNGETVTLENTNGKARLFYFFFSTCKDVCPPTTFVLSEVQEELKKEEAFGEDTAIIQITFDPENDTPERLKEFSSGYGADDSGWYFLTSDDQAYSQQITNEYGVAVQKMEDGDYAHTNVYVLVDKEGNIRNYYGIGNNIEDVDPAAIAKDMIELANE
ncbi:SCO family protein [Marinicrinis sediminis]|uniref:SCO family protein n=1 Tax=Marinicrinis sediminis TaxID=1652465 RepID=A0ABW5R7G1_9BACL